MKRILIFIFLAYSGVLFSQTKKAPLNVVVTDMAGRVIPNDKITFIGKTSKLEIVGITNERGRFSVRIPCGDEYDIKVAVIGEQMDYTSFEVPTPPPGVQFNTPTMEIRYKLPTSVVLEDVHFATGKYTIQKESYPVLDELAEYLIRKKTMKIRVEGHTDSDGSSSANKVLSENRAKAVKSYLEGKGVPSELIVAKGLGEEQPREDNSTARGKAKNRRTEIHIIEE